ncbi:MAG: hypothetical protein O6852_09285 [Gammaproteobacteria bacterium]|jgi:hypothetical protein|nr:hypothetical protein [Gammaproteobacteria bacterium]
MTSKVISTLYLLVCFVTLCGCGDTNSDYHSQSAVPSPPVRAPLDGLWSGEFDIGGRGPYDFTVLHLNGKAYAYSQHAKSMFVGTVNLEAENFSSKYLLFELDGGPFDSATIIGELTKENEIAAQFVTSKGGDTGAINLVYNETYDLPSSLIKTKGNWSYTDKEGLTTELIVQAQGTISGHDTDGCEYLGYLDLINPAYNAYQVKLEITACSSVSGEYDGVSFLMDGRLNLHIANEAYALYFSFDRQVESESAAVKTQ